MIIAISIAAILFYLLAALILYRSLFQRQAEEAGPRKSRFLVPGVIAVALHGIVLYQNVFTTVGLNLGFYNALSLMSWVVALIVILAAFARPLENLAVVIFPLTAIALALEIMFQSTRILPDTAPAGLLVHVLLSICAYSLLTIAALQATLLALQDRQISHKRPSIIMQLPPLQIMEDLMMQIIAIGFFLLSLSLVTGLMFLQDIFSQHLAHKAAFSTLAWVIFGILLWGRWSRGWRGRTAILWTIGGFISLLLAYFGSKLVLELILHRV